MTDIDDSHLDELAQLANRDPGERGALIIYVASFADALLRKLESKAPLPMGRTELLGKAISEALRHYKADPSYHFGTYFSWWLRKLAAPSD